MTAELLDLLLLFFGGAALGFLFAIWLEERHDR